MIEFHKKVTLEPRTKVVGINHTMQCTTCSEILGTLLESDELCKKFDKIVKFQCICHCGGESFIVKSKNTCYFVPVFNLNVVQSKIDEMKDYIKYQIILEKQ